MSDPLWRSALRALLIALFSILGIFLAFFLIILFSSSLTTIATQEEVPTNYDVEILPNADGVRKKLSSSAPVILQLNISGFIGGPQMTTHDISSLLIESRESTLKDGRVKGVLLNINSPGGTITDADGIYRAIKAYKEQYKVPVIAYVDGLCASGGFYIACSADEIYASNVSIVGSVGVIISSFLNFSKLLEKVGIDALTIYAGKGKDDMDPLRPWTPGEDKNIRALTDYYYMSFVDLVSNARPKLTKDLLIKDYGAKIYAASESAKFGYIDAANENRSSSLKKLLGKIGIEDDYYQVVQLVSNEWFSKLFSSEAPLFSGKIKHEISLPGDLPKELLNQPLYLYRP